MKRSLFIIFAAAILLLCACQPEGIASDPASSVPGTTHTQSTAAPTQTTAVPTQPTQGATQPTVPDIDPDFSAMPEMYTDLAQVWQTENIAIFAFITAGMDAADTTVITYDLLTDTLLGQVSLGEDMCSILPLTDGRFGVLSMYDGIYREFDPACTQVSETVLEDFSGGIGFAGVHENVILLSQLMAGKVFLYDLDTRTVTETDLAPGVYQYVGGYGAGFLLEAYGVGLTCVSLDGTSELLYKNGSAQVVGSTYAAGVRGDYITLLPLSGGDAVMAPCQSAGEIFAAADGVGLLSRSQNWDSADSLYYYAADSMTVTTVPVDGQIVCASVSNGCAVAVIRKDASQPLQFLYVDFSEYEQVSINKSAYDNGILNGVEPLPEPTGSQETVSLIRRLQETYGVRILYEPDVFDLESLGFALTPTDEATACERARLLEQFFAFLPDGLLKEMEEKCPVVIYLCQYIEPTAAGGMHTFLDGYSVIFLTVTGNDDYFLSVAAHEMGHALELCMEQSVVAGWRELMPEDICSAYENHSLTVEYTPDDKGRTPVWFLDAYSRMSEKEDRAVLFAALFDAWRSGDYTKLQYDGLRQKAQWWASALRESYESCEDAAFPWEVQLQ